MKFDADPEAILKEREERIPPIRVSQSEKRKFEKLAAARHLPLSTLIRQLLHREADAEQHNGKAA